MINMKRKKILKMNINHNQMILIRKIMKLFNRNKIYEIKIEIQKIKLMSSKKIFKNKSKLLKIMILRLKS